MALRTLGTNSTTILNALSAWSAVLTPADIAAISQAITSDFQFASVLGGYNSNPTGILATGVTHTSTLLDTLVATGGGALATINVGDMVLGAGIVPGTTVQAKPSASSVTLSQAATGSTAIRVAFIRPYDNPLVGLDPASAQLVIPNRGILKVLPGDVAAIDNTGWPILISGASIGYAGSQWTLT
jgi:hypothetical protein